MMHENHVNVLKFEAKSDRVMWAKIKLKEKSFSIVGVYGHTQVKSLADEYLEISFIKELQQTINMQPKKNTLIVFGKFNYKLEKTKNISIGS